MNPVDQSPTSGQATDPSLVDLMERNVKALVRTSAVLVKLSERLDIIEKRLDEGEPAPVTERRLLAPSPRLALRQDGAVLIELTSDIDPADVADREVARFVTLNEAERADAAERADEALGDVAARAGWQLARGRLGYPVPPSTTEPTS